jgi:hypothetical protein
MTTSSLITRFIGTARDRLTAMGETLSTLRTGNVDDTLSEAKAEVVG